MQRRAVALLTLALLSPVGLGGCAAKHAYVVNEALLARGDAAVPARRVKKDVGEVWLDTATIVERAPSDVPGAVRVVSAKRTRTLTAGVWLTMVGSVLSIVGSGLVFGLLNDRGPAWIAGLALTPVAEPLMIAGTVLWIRGVRQHPQELPRPAPAPLPRPIVPSPPSEPIPATSPPSPAEAP